MRTIAFVVVLLGTLVLAGCSLRHPASSASSESTAPPVSAPSASADPLSSLDSSLGTVDGAIQQSQGDLASGDASAAQDDDQ